MNIEVYIIVAYMCDLIIHCIVEHNNNNKKKDTFVILRCIIFPLTLLIFTRIYVFK